VTTRTARAEREAPGVETTGTTEAWSGHERSGPGSSAPGRVLRRLRLGHPLVAQVVLVLAAFVFGVAVSAALFVGIWRHTAAQGDEARAAQALTHRELRRARIQVGRLETKVAAERTLLVAARRREAALKRGQSALKEKEAELAASLAASRRVVEAIASRLPGQLASVAAAAGALGRQSSALVSDLRGLEAYLSTSSGSIDPGFAKTQIRYIAGAGSSTQAGAAELQAAVATASETVATLRR
jgi:hypothetical protein